MRKRVRELGIVPGILPAGKWNAITDVHGVKVGHVTLIEGGDIRTGVTVVLPHAENLFQDKLPAGIVVGNGFGKLMGFTQVKELGETNDSVLNNIHKRSIKKEHVLQAIEVASSGAVGEGCVGTGTGTICFGWKGGIGTSSRVLPEKSGGYTMGVLVQTNFGGILQIGGIPVGKKLGQYFLKEELENGSGDGSIMIVLATDAPLSDRNLKRLAKRGLAGLARTGASMSNGSGDFVIAFSTAEEVRRTPQRRSQIWAYPEVPNDLMSPLFEAAIEGTEEAIYNALCMAETMKGYRGVKVAALPFSFVENKESISDQSKHN